MVVAIIAILAAMLLPALRNARASARVMDCMNRMKQLGTVATMYMDENDGVVPAGGTTAISALGQVLGLSTTGNRVFGSPMWWCPFAELYEKDRTPGGPLYYPSPYVNGNPDTPRKKMIHYWNNLANGSNITNRAEISNPAKTILLFDRRIDKNGTWNSYHDGLSTDSNREQAYGSSRNLLFFDGHVEKEVISGANYMAQGRMQKDVP